MESQQSRAIQSINSIETIRKKRRKSQANQHVTKTVNKNKKKVLEIITFFVKFKLTTCLSVGSVNQNAVKVNNQDYWFNWDKIDDLRNDFMDFCSSKQRQLPDNDDGTAGMIIQESHENLSQYRSAP